MDIVSLESLLPIGVAVFSVVSAWYAVKLAAVKNADAIKTLHDRIENLAKQITALWQTKDDSVEKLVDIKYLRRDVDELRDKK